MADFHAKWEITFPSYSKILSYYRLPRKVRITCRNGHNMEEVSVPSRAYVYRCSFTVQPGQDDQMGKHYAP
jgi:hypothetical protein